MEKQDQRFEDSKYREDFRTKIYSMGANDELHGPALPRDIDDKFANSVVSKLCDNLGIEYVGHLPYSGDGLGRIAAHWNFGYLDSEEMIERIGKRIKLDREDREGFMKNTDTHFERAFIYSGHGGNNFVGTEQAQDFISEEAGVPVTYLAPLAFGPLEHNGKDVYAGHAGDVEHSLALLIGCLNQEGLKDLTEGLKTNIKETLKKYPQINSFSGYLLHPEHFFKGEDYPLYEEKLAMPHRVERLEKFLQNPTFNVSKDIGKLFFDKEIESLSEKIK